MLKLFFFFCLSILNSNFIIAQKKLELPKIADSLFKNANSIVYSNIVDVQIKGDSKVVTTSKKIVTILNKKAEEEALFVDYEDDFRKIDEVLISAYDINGKLINSYKKKQLEKVKHNDGFSLVTDDKLYYFEVPIYKFPITIVIEKKIIQNAFMDVEDIELHKKNQAIVNMQYKYTMPFSNALRYFNKGLNVKPVITNTTNEVQYFFELNNIKPALNDSLNEKREALEINIAPTFFEMDNYKGDYSSWKTFGNWYYTLYSQQKELSEVAVNEIKSIAAKANSTTQKISLLYKYLQNNYRYVSVQLGIGGFKPFEPSFVYKNKYGDCKALSNYMQTILQTVGIQSNQVLINAGRNFTTLNPNFVANTFNHVILCVPNAGDTIWLECTSNSDAPNVLGSFTENRLALAITPNGGVLVRTPNSIAVQNTLYTSTVLNIASDWSAIAQTLYFASGVFKELLEDNITKSNEVVQRDFLLNYIKHRPFDEFAIMPIENNEIRIKFLYNKIFDFKIGSKYFIKAQLHNLNNYLLNSEAGATSFNFKFPFVKTDTLVIEMPENFKLENKNTNLTITLPNGTFNNQVVYNELTKKLTIITNFTINNTLIEAAQMKDFTEAAQKIKQSLQESLVLILQ